MYKPLLWLTLFSIAMAHVESALVVHLRSVYYPDDPTVIFPLAILSSRDLLIELARESATVIMILCVAALAVRSGVRMFTAFLYVFGMWDISYYAWLKVMIDWPVSWLDWDVLFLIPWPWLGPWLAPAMIALLFAVWGARSLTSESDIRLSAGPLALFVIGSLVDLITFLLPAWPLLSGGEAAFRAFRPDGFLWGLFAVGFLLMTAGLVLLRRGGRPQD